MPEMKLICDGCKATYDMKKTSEIPAHIFVIHCNWCPKCEDSAEDYWEQYWDDNEDGNNGTPLPTPVPDNQLCFPFIFDELEILTPSPTQPTPLHQTMGNPSTPVCPESRNHGAL